MPIRYPGHNPTLVHWLSPIHGFFFALPHFSNGSRVYYEVAVAAYNADVHLVSYSLRPLYFVVWLLRVSRADPEPIVNIRCSASSVLTRVQPNAQ
jgi:hypothetical protein